MANTRLKYNQLKETPSKRACKVATTANISNLLSGAPDTVDGVSLSVKDRVLVKDQSTGSQNGIYEVVTVGTGADGVWQRSSDLSTSDDTYEGIDLYVTSGSTNADTIWHLTTPDPITIGTTSLTFSQFQSGVSGSGTTFYFPKWTGSDTLSSTSLLYDNNTFVGLNTTTQDIDEKLRVTGGVRFDDSFGFFRVRNGAFVAQNDIASTNFSIISNGGGISIASLKLIGATSGYGRIHYGKTGNTQKFDIYNELTTSSVITLTSNDDVGIGKSNPGGKLHVSTIEGGSVILDLLNDGSQFDKNKTPKFTKQGETTTTGTNTSTIATIPLTTNNDTITVRGIVTAYNSFGSLISIGGDFMAVAARDSGVSSIINTVNANIKHNSVGSPSFTVTTSGTNVLIQVTGGGDTGTTSWLVTYEYQIVNSPVA